MKSRKNDKSVNPKDWTLKKLKEMAKSYDDTIHGENVCYGVRDMILLEAILSELDKRGVDYGYALNIGGK